MIKKFYLKLLMSLMLVALAVPQVWADELTVAEDATADESYVPLYGSYMENTGTYSQTIYTSAQLSSIAGNNITAITYYPESALPSNLNGNVLEIFLKEVDENGFSSTSPITGMTSYGTCTISSGDTQVVFNLNTPFNYSGNKNLAIEVHVKAKGSGSGWASGLYWYAKTSDGNIQPSLYHYSTTTSKSWKIPKTTFTYEAGSTDPTIRVDNNALNFSALVGSSVTSIVAVTGKNLTGDITANVTGDGFSVNPETLGTTGGNLTITYAPTAAGTHNGTLTLSSAGAEDVVITLTGLAEAPTTSGTVSPTSLTFNSYPDVAATQTITIENTGNTAFTPSFTIAAPFSIEVATEIAAGASKDFTVTYTPTAVGTDNGTLAVDINGTTTNVTLTGTATEAPKEATVADGTERNYKLPVYGYYYDNANNNYNQMIYLASMIPSYLTGKKITSLTFYSSGLKFSGGNLAIRLATTDAEKFTSTAKLDMPSNAVSQNFVHHANEALDPITVTFDEPFEYNGGNIIIETQVTTAGTCDPYNSTTYQPDYTYFYGVNTTENYSYCGKGSYGNAQLLKFLPKVTFAYEESETPATPVITVDPATVDAFSTEVGTPVTATVNVSGENLTDAITTAISGENADCFTAALENGVLTITYNPTAAGNHTATLTLSSTGAEDVTIALTGTATATAQPYAVTVNPENGYNFGNVIVDNTKVWTLTVTNNGTESVTPTLTGLEAPFSTTYTAAPLAAGESVSIEISFAPTGVEDYTNAITLSFPETTIADYTFELTGKGVNEYAPTADNEVVRLITVDKRSIYVPDFIDEANGNTTPQQLNCYDMRFKMAQLDDPDKQIKAGDLRPGNNLFEFYAIDDFGTEFRFATINLFAEGQPSSNPSVSAMDAPIVVTPSVEYYTEDGMPVHPTYTHNTTLKYTEKIYNDINDLVDLEGVIDYVNDTWSANVATNAHPDHYKFQIRGVGQFGEKVTELTAEYVKSHMTGYGGSLVDPEGWYRSMVVAPNNEYDDDGNYVDTYYFYDLYISNEFLQSKGITGPVTVVINTTLSKSGYNADEFKTISVNGVDQIIAKEKFKDYSWTVPLVDEMYEGKSMGIVIRSETRPGSDFNKTRSIYIYGGGTGVSNVDTVGIYKSSMNVKAYTQKQVDEDTDRGLVAMNSNTGVKADVNVLAYGDPAVTGYILYENNSASTTGMSQVASANHEANGKYTVNSTGTYNGTYNYVRDESLGNIDGMWLPMYPADASMYYLPVTWANGVGDDGVVRSENNTYGSAMQQVEKNGSVSFNSSKCERSQYTWVKDGVTYSYYSPEVDLNGVLPADGYELYNYRFWVDYDEDAPAWDFEIVDGKTHLTTLMDRPLAEGTTPHLGGQIPEGGKVNWVFVAPADLDEVKLVARYYYKKTSTGKARPTDSDRLYYVVENQVTVPVGVITGIDNVSSKAVASVKYYNMMGIESDVPFEGVNIEVITFTDGSRSSRKIMK